MSKSIDSVKVQIPGTMYYLQLAEDRGRWVLSLLLRGDVEKEVIVPVFSKNGINKSANELLNNTRLVIDKYPLRNVCDQLYIAAESSLPTQQQSLPTEEVIDSDELDELKQKLDLIENTLENVVEELKEEIESINNSLKSLETDRVARLEAELSKDDDKKDEEFITKLADRLDHIEESIVQGGGDDRVPSILTAIEALESKISQLEGSSITNGGSISAPTTEIVEVDDISNMKLEFGKLSQAFDMINQRLTNIEFKLKEIAPPGPTEGSYQPPTE